MMYEICDELDVPYLKNGTTVFATDEQGMQELYKLQDFAQQNGVHVEIVTPPQLYELQPDIGKDVKAVLWVPEGGVTTPFTVTFALAENAYMNGVEFRKDAEVTAIEKTKDGFAVSAGDEKYECSMIVNCAGGCSDIINNMVSENKYHIIPRFGAHVVLDRKVAEKLNTTLMETPHDLPGGGHTKGMAIIPTLGGTVLLGCDATQTDDPDMTTCYRSSIDQIIDYFKESWKDLPLGSDGSPFPMDAVISVFGGCRPHADTNDFVIGEAEDVPGFVNAGGTESPAFTSAVAIARHVTEICVDKLHPEVNEAFDPVRKAKKAFRIMTDEERIEAIAQDPDYAKIVCRCEMVTEAEIRDAIRRPLGARAVSEVKLRTRAGMGRCQGGFCSTRVLEILAEELGIDPLEVTQCGGNSYVLADRVCKGE
jgi:glycerol-3-phosphate dehydrogenase